MLAAGLVSRAQEVLATKHPLSAIDMPVASRGKFSETEKAEIRQIADDVVRSLFSIRKHPYIACASILIAVLGTGLIFFIVLFITSTNSSIDALRSVLHRVDKEIAVMRAEQRRQANDITRQRAELKTYRVATALRGEGLDPKHRLKIARQALRQTFRSAIWVAPFTTPDGAIKMRAYVFVPREGKLWTFTGNDTVLEDAVVESLSAYYASFKDARNLFKISGMEVGKLGIGVYPLSNGYFMFDKKRDYASAFRGKGLEIEVKNIPDADQFESTIKFIQAVQKGKIISSERK